MEDNLADLRKKVLNTERALQDFKQSDISVESSGATRSQGERRVVLSELENAALSARTVYNSFLQRYTETLQSLYSPVELKIVSPATPPLYKSGPKIRYLLAGGALAGAILGLLIALMQEHLDRTIRDPTSIEMIGVSCLGLLPKVSVPDTEVAIYGPSGASVSEELVPGSLLIAASAPTSYFAEVLRSVKLTLDIWTQFQPAKVVAVTSTALSEGKTTVAANLAQTLASMGARTLLLDCDIRTASLTRALVPHAKVGLFEVLSGEHRCELVICEEPNSNLYILPTVLETQTADGFSILTSSSFKNLIEELRKKYDYVIIDTESMRPFARMRAITSLIDTLIFVVEWGKTDLGSFMDTLKAADIPDNVLVGALINKVDAKNSPYFSDETSASFANKFC